MRGQCLSSVTVGFVLLAVLLALVPPIPAAAQNTTGRLCVTAFHDANRNHLRDSIEPLLGGVVVTVQDAQAVVVASYLTDGSSEPHCFTDLIPGTYTVTFDGGQATATGQNAFGVMLSAGQTAQAVYGAVPAPAQTSASGTFPGGSTPLRVALSCAGSAFAMLLMLGFGMIVAWLRYR